MYYDFIAEFFANSNDAEPIYRTYVNGVQDAEGFIREKGFVEVADKREGDFVLETDMECLNGWVDANLNPELLTICLEGEVCDRVRIYAFEYHAGEGRLLDSAMEMMMNIEWFLRVIDPTIRLLSRLAEDPSQHHSIISKSDLMC